MARPEGSRAAGGVGGFLVGLTSVGSGSVIMAPLVFVVPLPPVKLVGTDIAHAVVLVGASAIGHALLGNVDYALALQLLLGSVPGVVLGTRATVHAPRRVLQACLAALLIVSGLHLMR